MKKPCGKNADGTPNRGQQVSVIAQEKWKLGVFLFHHRWRYTFDWGTMGVHEDTVHLLAKKLEDRYKAHNVVINLIWQEQFSPLQNVSDHVMVS